MTSRLGAEHLGDGRTRFVVWAPKAERVELALADAKRSVPLTKDEHGYHSAVVENVRPGARYSHRLDGGDPRPDPASLLQPEGVHGASAVVERAFAWTDDAWKGVALRDLVLYELHVGTFSEGGTFDSAIAHLDELVDLGVTAIEIMPIAQFPGGRNWGYDGVGLFAAQNTYGGPDGLRRLVDACHARGLGVFLDVVYNHLGPEGNYLSQFGPYFTDQYKTPWGWALNYDGPYSDEVRRYFIENALWWIEGCHVDGLRLDAVHAICDRSSVPFLEELARAVRAFQDRSGRRVHLIGETDANDPRTVRSYDAGGIGLDGHWNDDFHHALRVALTGERLGYYSDFTGVEDVARALTRGYVREGQYSPARKRRHGRPADEVRSEQLVVYAQNHDQVGNRMVGDRLPADALRVAAAAVILSPFVPLVFMGEEWGETNPFLYFVSHGDQALVEAVRKGRREEFSEFAWQGEPPDPASEETFLRSRLDRARARSGEHASLRELYKRLIAIRRSEGHVDRSAAWATAFPAQETVLLHRGRLALVLHFGRAERKAFLPLGKGSWRTLLDPSGTAPATVPSDGQVALTLGPRSFVLLEPAP